MIEPTHPGNELDEDWVRSEQVRQLYDALPAALAISLAVGLVLVAAFWGAMPRVLLVGWWLTHLAISGARMGLVWAYQRQALSTAGSVRWLRYFLYGVLLAGCVWGAAGLLFFPGNEALRLVLLAITLAGISAGAVTSLAPFWPAALLFLAPVLLPFLVRNLVADFALSMPMAGMTGLFSVGMGVLGRRIAHDMGTNIRLRIEATRQQKDLSIYQAVFEQSRDAVILLNQRGFQYCNQATLELFGIGNVETFCAYHPVDLSPVYQPDGQLSRQAADARLKEAFQEGRAFFEWHHRRVDGTEFQAEVLLSRIDLPHDALLQALVRDVSEQKQLEAQLAYQASHDPLTGLPNRTLLEDRLNHALKRAHRRSHGGIALLFLDLDRFKEINDTLGHSIGDRLLQALADRISRLMRGGETFARLGGDEFIFCLEWVTGAGDASAAAQRIQQAIAQPFELEGHRIQSTCSIGMSVYPGDATTVEGLFRHADLALYRAKMAGRNRMHSYAEELI